MHAPAPARTQADIPDRHAAPDRVPAQLWTASGHLARTPAKAALFDVTNGSARASNRRVTVRCHARPTWRLPAFGVGST